MKLTLKERTAAPALVLLCALVSTWASVAFAGQGVVLLSFDTEYEPDAKALNELAIGVPATYFFTGEYAMEHPELLRRLAAEGNTIGSHSHSHDHLTTLSPGHLDQDLRRSKQVIEAISGVGVRWFRAPYLEYDRNVMSSVRAAGFSRDSSDIAHWPRNQTLAELPISHHDGRLVSDYEIFVREKLSDREALDWLKDAYETRARYGHPLVLLLHPRISAKRPEVLRDFVAHVQAAGGAFLTMDNYVDGLAHDGPLEVIGLRVDLGNGQIDPETLASKARSIGATDVFLSVLDRQGRNHLVADPADGARSHIGPILSAMRDAEIRVHAWIRVTENPALAAARPELAMERNDGTPSKRWLSPSNPQTRAALAESVMAILTAHPFDGIHLDSMQYPGLEVDFSLSALNRFSEDTGIPVTDPGLLLSNHYQSWVDWRMAEIAGLARYIGHVARKVAGPGILVSATLVEDAATDYLPRERMGLSYHFLSRELDLIVLSPRNPPGQQDEDGLKRILYAARWQVGDTPVIVGLALGGVCNADNLGIAPSENDAVVNHALSPGNGVVFSYDQLLDCP